MTRNNLRDHLAWLLDSKLSIPPIAHTLPPAPLSFTQADISPPQEDLATPQGSTQTDRSTASATVEVQTVETADMARLRTEPGSARNRNLVSVGPRLDTAQGARSTAVTPKPVTSMSTASRATPYSTARQLPYSPQDVEIMDLTQSMDQLQSPSRRQHAGRKRKSSEMTKDMSPARRPDPGPTHVAEATPSPLKASQQSFTAIDEIMEQPAYPPPPYSTIAPRHTSPVRKVARQNTPPSHPSKSLDQDNSRVLPDSEDDESENIVDFNRSRSKTPTTAKRKEARQESQPYARVAESPLRRAHNAQPENFVLPEKDVERALRTTFAPGSKAYDGGPSHANTPAPSSIAAAAQGSSSEDHATIERFFEIPQVDVKGARDRLHEESERLVAELCERCENDEDDADVQKMLDDVDERRKALELLNDKQQGYQACITERDRVRAALGDAVRAKEGQEDAKVAVKSSKSRTRSFLDDCVEYLKLCRPDVAALLDQVGDGKEGIRDVAVQSTQATMLLKQPYVPSSSRVAQTQVVRPRASEPVELEGSLAVTHKQDRGLPQNEAYFSPARGVSTSISRQPARPSRAQQQVFQAAAQDAFNDLDDEDMMEASNELFSNRMGSPSGQFNDEDEFDMNADDLLNFAEDYENHDVRPRQPHHNEDRPALAPTSGNSKPSNRSPKSAKKRAATKNDGQDYEKLFRFPWSHDVKTALRDRFKLRGFRQNQLEAINATLAGKDTFVLMPTGGGKSLCYQLPSLIKSGKTRGVTVVVSPLLSLMEDQVQHLRKNKIQAHMINSVNAPEERRAAMAAMEEEDAEDFIQLLYVSPEMLSKNQRMMGKFDDLYARQKLARLVIDEAHCVSQWGHDFRPDYKLLGDIRRRYPRVPVMALTATATENVKLDTIHNLSIPKCEIFASSFNRPNLFYEVRPKGKGKSDVSGIGELIKESHSRQTGIVYCFSRKDCETTAETLAKQYKIKAHHYHAGLEPEERSQILKMWQSGKYHVIVATIAFGMGIDKPDVRFVIHHTMPKSLEGYYQETGRAGRDQLASGCYLFYGYQDAGKLKRMIDDGDGNWEQKDRQHHMLRKMVQFCENRSDCRRVQVLQYFNERFTPDECVGKCDNCLSATSSKTVDFTAYAEQIIELIEVLAVQKVTLLHCIDVFRGALSKKVKDRGHDQLELHGAGSDLNRGEVERVFYHLVTEGAIVEENHVNKMGFANQYVALGRHARDFGNGRKQLKMQVQTNPERKEKPPAKKKAKKDMAEEHSISRKKTAGSRAQPTMPMSTNISSPVPAAASRRNPKKATPGPMHGNGYQRDGFIVSDPEDQDYDMPRAEETDDDYGFEPVRVAGQQAPKKSGPTSGNPITVDQAMDGLDELERCAVDNFVQSAGEFARKLLMDRKLRIVPFSDTILRQMAINCTDTEAKMLEIPGIDSEKVRHFGKQFAKLVRQYREQYEAMRGPDPNAQNVIDLVSDEEQEEDEDSDYGEFPTDGEEEEASTYFQPRASIQQYRNTSENSQFGGGRAAAGPSKPAKGNKKSYKAVGSGARSWKNGAKGRASNVPNGGVKKRKVSGKRTSRGGAKEEGGGGHGRGDGGGGGSNRKIRMMET